MLRIDDHMVAPPLQSAAIRGGQSTVAANDQHHCGRDRSRPEDLLEYLGVRLIIQQPEPVDELAQSMLAARRPLGVLSCPLHEDAVRPAVLELDQRVGAGSMVATYQIGRELSEERDFQAQAVIGVGAPIIRADQGTEVRVAT